MFKISPSLEQEIQCLQKKINRLEATKDKNIFSGVRDPNLEREILECQKDLDFLLKKYLEEF